MLKIKNMNSNNVIRQGDTQPREYQLDTGNLGLNLTNKSATIRLMTADFQGIGYETTATVSSDNKISFSIDDVIPAREYRLEVTVDDYVFPSRATDGQFNIDPSSHGQEASIIQIIGKDEIVREVKEQIEPFLGEIEQAELARQEAEGVREETHEKVKDLPEAFQNVIDETTGKDVISAPEIIAARRGKASLGEKIDEVTTQLAQKAKQSYAEGVNKRIDNLVIPLSPENSNVEVTDSHVSITKNKKFDSLPQRLEETEQDHRNLIHISPNLLDPNKVSHGSTVEADSSVVEDEGRWLSDFIEVREGETINFSGTNFRFGRYDENKNKLNRQIELESPYTVAPLTKFIRISVLYVTASPEDVMINRGSALLPFEPYGIKIREELLPEVKGVDLELNQDPIYIENLWNPSETTTGVISSSSGNVNPHATNRVSFPIPIHGGENYTLSSERSHGIFFYESEEGDYIEGTSWLPSNEVKTIKAPDNANFARLTLSVTTGMNYEETMFIVNIGNELMTEDDEGSVWDDGFWRGIPSPPLKDNSVKTRHLANESVTEDKLSYVLRQKINEGGGTSGSGVDLGELYVYDESSSYSSGQEKIIADVDNKTEIDLIEFSSVEIKSELLIYYKESNGNEFLYDLITNDGTSAVANTFENMQLHGSAIVDFIEFDDVNNNFKIAIRNLKCANGFKVKVKNNGSTNRNIATRVVSRQYV